MAPSRYSKGYLTKSKIINAAKDMFYRDGYNMVTTLEICKVTNIKNGNFTYYFGTKQDLADEIFNELMVNAESFTEQHIPPTATLLQKSCIGTTICFIALLRDPETCRFVYEVSAKGFLASSMAKSARSVYKLLNEQMHLGLTDAEFEVACIADTGVRTELLMKTLTESNLSPTIEQSIELACNINTIMGRIFKMDERDTFEAVTMARNIINNYDISKIRLLR